MSNLKKWRHHLYEYAIWLWPVRKGRARWLNVMHKAFRIESAGILRKKRIGEYYLTFDLGSGERYFYFGISGYGYTKLVNRLLKPGDRVIDVGANVGHFSATCAALVGTTGKVYAIEAHPIVFKRLAEAVSRQPRGAIRAIHAAVWYETGEIVFFVSPNSCESSLILTELFVIDREVPVRAITLDKLAQDENLTEIQLLKLDIEGAETNALMGARAVLTAGLFNHILLEAEPVRLQASGHTGAEIDAMLTGYGYVPIAYIRNDKIHLVTEETRIPGSFNADYLYSRKPLAESMTSSLF